MPDFINRTVAPVTKLLPERFVIWTVVEVASELGVIPEIIGADADDAGNTNIIQHNKSTNE
jgi:hypothetical protein